MTPNLIHRAQFISGHELPIATLSLLNADGGTQPGAQLPELGQQQALKMYRSMVYTRVLDERMISAQRQGRLSFYVSCIGEEASVTGTAAAFAPEDMIMGQYREQAALSYRGFSSEQFMDQLLGRAADLGKGRQMPVHYGSAELNFMTISSPLATQIPQAAGYAYAQKLAGKAACTLCYFGEGAASEGDFHAGLNMAAVLNCPVVFVCRNNGYAISTPAAEQFKGDGIAARGVGYGIKTIRVDGNDLLAVYAAATQARKLALQNNEPVLIETMSYRLGAHSTSDDPSGYRSRDEEDKWREKDPIERMRLWLQTKGWWSEADDKKLLESYRREVLETLKRVEKKPMPPLGDLIEDVYRHPPAHLQQQFAELQQHIAKYPEHYPIAGGAKHG
ncbi:MAG: thiamine pyrophosphate-dependent dehydrogenase E1 component subunit alpha [Cellvibrionaceae bacterium]|nr:thiamine pyrophosphate-dependent dehydrogenase E1 component subunit alpha [Cellvibrionaceae bacterium]